MSEVIKEVNSQKTRVLIFQNYGNGKAQSKHFNQNFFIFKFSLFFGFLISSLISLLLINFFDRKIKKHAKIFFAVFGFRIFVLKC